MDITGIEVSDQLEHALTVTVNITKDGRPHQAIVMYDPRDSVL